MLFRKYFQVDCVYVVTNTKYQKIRLQTWVTKYSYECAMVLVVKKIDVVINCQFYISSNC